MTADCRDHLPCPGKPSQLDFNKQHAMHVLLNGLEFKMRAAVSTSRMVDTRTMSDEVLSVCAEIRKVLKLPKEES